MKNEKRDFDKEAAAWDEQPTRVKLANDIAAAIVNQITITTDMDALDFGCGTGLLTLQLQPLIRSITGVDSSRGMLEVFQVKIAKLQLANVRTRLCDLDQGEMLEGRYDLIVSGMTLHHVKEIAPLLAQFHAVMATGGTLCLADLDLEGGQFHADSTGVFHNGFDRAVLRQLLVDAGFVGVTDETAAEIEKPARDGAMKRFSVFLMTGKKML